VLAGAEGARRDRHRVRAGHTPAVPRGRRKAYIALTGQKLLPAIEREDGSIIREESKDLAERVRDGRLDSP